MGIRNKQRRIESLRAARAGSDSVSYANDLCWKQGRAEAQNSCVSLEKQAALPAQAGISPRCLFWALAISVALWAIVIGAIVRVYR